MVRVSALVSLLWSASAQSCDITSNSAYNGSRVANVQKGGSLEDCCTSCGGLSLCTHYTYHPETETNPSVCYLQTDDGVETKVSRNFSHGVVTARKFCEDELGCSLAGECVGGSCVCDGWTHGDHCEILNLLPVDAERFGYRNSSGFNSWGGGPVLVGDKWHLFASQMQGKCPLSGYWSSVSEAVHSVSDHPLGPFENANVVVPAFAHNVKPFQHPDGTFLIYYVGNVNNETKDCSHKSSLAEYPLPKEAAGPVMIASAPHPDTPAAEWEHHGPFTDSFDWHSATNPSPIFLPNGSVMLFVARRWATSPTKATKNLFVMMADSWRGPYRNITHTFDEALKTGEDPHVFKTKRGYHMLGHNTGPSSSGLSFSADGLNWNVGKSVDAFNATLQWSNGSVTHVCRRQRPYVVLAEDGMPGWLWNGVMDGPMDGACELNPTWTLGQAIGRSSQFAVV